MYIANFSFSVDLYEDKEAYTNSRHSVPPRPYVNITGIELQDDEMYELITRSVNAVLWSNKISSVLQVKASY